MKQGDQSRPKGWTGEDEKLLNAFLDEATSAQRVKLEIDVFTLVELIGVMQLALRHPNIHSTPKPVETARKFIDDTAGLFGSMGLHACAEVVYRGDDPDNDMGATR